MNLSFVTKSNSLFSSPWRPKQWCCSYIKEGKCKYQQLSELTCCDDHESLWLYLRPNRIPRGFSCIVAAVIYHPQKANDISIRNFLFQSLALVESKYLNYGFLTAGDFNPLDINHLLRHFHLRQNVTASPRKDATLDLVLTNVHEFYTSPLAFPPFGLSDHSTVEASPTSEKDNPTPVPRE